MMVDPSLNFLDARLRVVYSEYRRERKLHSSNYLKGI